jgi:magnesium-transporting ATPase (P-type)
MIKHIASQSLYQVAVLMVILYAGNSIWNVPKRSAVHYTLIFNSFVWCQIFNEINCRTVIDELNIFRGFFTNFVFLAVIAITAICQTLIVEFTGKVFKVDKLSWVQWVSCIGIGAFSLVLGFIFRLVPVPQRHFMDIFFFWRNKGGHQKLSDEIDDNEMNLNEVPLEEKLN